MLGGAGGGGTYNISSMWNSSNICLHTLLAPLPYSSTRGTVLLIRYALSTAGSIVVDSLLDELTVRD
jgi:hypothetical protein